MDTIHICENFNNHKCIYTYKNYEPNTLTNKLWNYIMPSKRYLFSKFTIYSNDYCDYQEFDVNDNLIISFLWKNINLHGKVLYYDKKYTFLHSRCFDENFTNCFTYSQKIYRMHKVFM